MQYANKKTSIDPKGLKIREAATARLSQSVDSLKKTNKQIEKNRENIAPNTTKPQKSRISSPLKRAGNFIQNLLDSTRTKSPTQQGSSVRQSTGSAKTKATGKQQNMR